MKIGIIGAMESEVSLLIAQMKDKTETKAGQITIAEGKIGNVDTAVVRCGIGKTAAAVCAQVLIDRCHITHLINTGIAGSLNAAIDIGDAVVSTDAVHHDFELGALGYPPGTVPGMGGTAFKADENLRRMCVEAIKTAGSVHVFEGTVASGDQFISSKEKKEWIRSTFGAECCEMEGASIAQTAYVNQIPYVIIRMISDKADDSATVTYSEFETKAANDSAQLLLQVLHTIGEKE